MAELVDARDSKSRAARRAGSIPALGTRILEKKSTDFGECFFYFRPTVFADFLVRIASQF